MRDRSWRMEIALGLCVVSLGAAFFVYLWALGPRDFRADPAPCFETGAPFHHRYRPSCRESMRTPQGRVEFQTNEAGLRDLPRDLLLSLGERVLVVGDSFVEGWWLRDDQALSSQLRERHPERYFINAGLRGTGPLFQAPRVPKLLADYKPRELWLSLNDTDVLDDRLACALAEKSGADPAGWSFRTDDFQLTGWQTNLLRLFRGWRLEPKLRNGFEQSRRRSFAMSDAGKSCDPCAGIQSLRTSADAARVPVRAFVVDLGFRGRRAIRDLPDDAVETLTGCLEDARIPFFTLRLDELSPAEQDKYLWAGSVQFNSLGAEYWAKRIDEAGDVGAPAPSDKAAATVTQK